MYPTLLFFHSVFRWLVLVFLLYALYRAWTGLRRGKKFLPHDNFMRHTTATVAHVQLMIGVSLYFTSPVSRYFLQHTRDALGEPGLLFFGLLHALLMLVAVVLVTLGSAFAKRKTSDHDRFKTMFIWFGIALLIIFIAVPWPFSPLAARPYLRPL